VHKVIFVLSFTLLLPLGAAELCIAQWGAYSLTHRGWDTDMQSSGYWPFSVERDSRYPYLEGHRFQGIPISLPEGRLLRPEKIKTISGIIKNDFLVNDDTTGGCWQGHPAVAMDTSGDFVICWVDGRNGERDIYAQRYSSSGDRLGTDFRVNDDAGSSFQEFPSIAMDAYGDFIICWQDGRNGDYDIYAQRYSMVGDRVGVNLRVNDDVGTSWQRYPSVSMDAYGDFIICWQDGRSGDYDIYAQRYNMVGDRVGINSRVNDDAGASNQWYPSVAMDVDGGFAICWGDERNGWDNPDIYAQRYNSSGETLETNFKVNNDVGTSRQGSPSIAMDLEGDFVICWVDDRNGEWDYDIYAQRYSSTGDTLRANFRVNDDSGASYQCFPSVSTDLNGDFVICWEDWRNGEWDYDIYAQRYSNLGGTLGANFKVNDNTGTSGQYSASVSMDAYGDFIICWQDSRNSDLDIYAQRYNSSGDTLGTNFKVNNDVGMSCQDALSIAMDADGNFVICWQDERNGNSDIYAQRYSSSGDTLGGNFRVNDDAGSSWQWYPSVAMGRNSGFVICWGDERNGWDNPDIYAQRFNSLGDSLDRNFRVNDNGAGDWQWSPSVAMDAGGDFVICWVDSRNGDRDIYAQRYSSSGDRLGTDFRVNDDAGTSNQWYPSVAMDVDGGFAICWGDERNGWDNPDIYAQRYNSSGETLETNFKVNNDVGTNGQGYPSMAMDTDGNFVICWQDERNGNSDIYAQRYSSSGDTLGGNFRVNDDAGSSWQWYPSVAMGRNSGFVICWQDARNGDWNIYAQRYHADGTRWGGNYLVNQRPDVPNPDQLHPSIALNNDRIVFTWEDIRRSKGWDIYAKVVSWDWDKVDEKEDENSLPQDFALFQNYPNPFNSTTAISYQLSAVRLHRTSLKIYNTLGQEVKTLVNEEQPAGNYQVLWDGRDSSGKQVASGVYFCRLEVTGGRFKVEKTRKMVILR